MRRFFLLISALGLLSASCALAEQTGVIGGVVRNGWSKAPIKRVIVTLRTTGMDIEEAVTYSEANGAFAFTGVPSGEYTLCARENGYERACFGGPDELGRPLALLKLATGQQKRDIVLALLPNGSVSGTVSDADGDPVPNARISLLRPSYTRRTLHWQTTEQTSSNTRGEYHLPFSRPGEVRVMAMGQNQQVQRVRPEAVAGQTVTEEMYTPQYYPAAASMDAAASLTLSAGNELKGIDFTLSTTPELTINGAVIPPPGMEKAGSVTIEFIPENQVERSQSFYFGAEAPNYNFQASVPEGRYRLIALAEDKNRTYRADQFVDAAAAGSNLSINLIAGTPLTGKLIVEGESLSLHGPYTVNLTSGEDFPGDGQTPSAEVSETGAFEFASVFPGIWDIGLTPRPPGAYIKSMRLGDEDVLTRDMRLQDGARKPLTIVLSTKGAVVSGNVLSPDGSGAVTDIRARLLLAPSGKYEDVLGFYKATITDSKGHYEFKGVGPGTYKIYAFDRLRSDEYWKPDFLKPFTATAGDPVTVAEAARVTHDVTVILRDPAVTE